MYHVKRHMDMGAMSLMASLMASLTVAAASSMTSAMGSMATESDMAAMDHGSSGLADSMHGSMSSMHMYFTTQYKDYPVLFKTLSASNKGQAFGIFVLLFAVGFFTRGIEFARNYLELVVWKNPTYVECHPGQEPAAAACCDLPNKLSSDSEAHQDFARTHTDSQITSLSTQRLQAPPSRNLSFMSELFRNAVRLVLCILPDLFGFALMLAAMSYTLTYFFAVVLGLGVGRFVFERLSDRMNLKPLAPTFHC